MFKRMKQEKTLYPDASTVTVTTVTTLAPAHWHWHWHWHWQFKRGTGTLSHAGLRLRASELSLRPGPRAGDDSPRSAELSSGAIVLIVLVSYHCQ
jgi:hypothetical protein